MRKKDLINQVMTKLQKQETTLKRKDVERIINMFLDILENTILYKKEEKIQLSGFGTFYIKERQPRIGRNPKTGDLYKIPVRYNLTFKPSQNFVLQVNHKKKS
ncbi:HU family DNA-binding protein [Hydrogenobaculum acidophilum]